MNLSLNEFIIKTDSIEAMLFLAFVKKWGHEDDRPPEPMLSSLGFE